MAKRSGGRWYDRYPPLNDYLERLRELPEKEFERIVKGLRDVVVEQAPGLIDDTAMDFPLDALRRRWYDKEPICWLTINSLRVAEREVVDKAIAYLGKQLSTPA